MGVKYDLIVIGSGVAGMAAAKRAHAAGLRVAVLESLLYGGLVTNVNELEGDVGGPGAELAARMADELMGLGVELLSEQAMGIDKGREAFGVATEERSHAARAIVVASGARLRKLGIPGEERLRDKGVSHCADCDGPLFAGQPVIVVGGGDSALQSALTLANHAGRVHLVHRRDAFRARRPFVEQVERDPRIEIHRNSEVRTLVGDEALAAARVARVGEAAEAEWPVAGFFAFVGLEPVSDFVPPAVRRDAAGFLLADPTHETSLPGLFVAGAARTGCGGSIADAMADGEAAAASAAQMLRVATQVI